MVAFDLAKTLSIPALSGYLNQVEDQMQSAAKATGSLQKPLLQTVNAKSKRLRPALVIASAMVSKINASLIAGATAIELLHLGSLVHDDVIDNAKRRWGRLTLNAGYSQATAILAGDYLLARAGTLAAQISAEAAGLIADTVVSLSLGESQEITDRFNLARTEKDYFECIGAKTGALISAACQMGGICAGLSPSHIQALAGYGQNLGISFQIIDDVLDIVSTSKLLGKPVSADAAQGVYTLPVLLTLAGPDRQRLEAILRKPDGKNVAGLLIANGSVQRSIGIAKKYNQQAISALKIVGPEFYTPLAKLPDSYLEWAMVRLVARPHLEALASSL